MSLTCVHCPFSCYHRDLFTLHMAENHLFSVWFQCHNCADKFFTKDEVVRHILEIHNSKRPPLANANEGGLSLKIKNEMGNVDLDSLKEDLPPPRRPLEGVQEVVLLSDDEAGADQEDLPEAANPSSSTRLKDSRAPARPDHGTAGPSPPVSSSALPKPTLPWKRLSKSKYRCGYCRRLFKSYGNVSVHVREQHTHKDVRFKCPTCHLSYKRKTSLKLHMKNGHPLPDVAV